jgi:hypothetical protein
MAKASGMSAPVTRGELQEELKLLRGELQQAVEPLATKTELQQAVEPLATKTEFQQAVALLATKAELQQAVALLATKVELEMWGGALLERIDSGERRMQALEHRLIERIERMQQQLQTDLARHANALHESMAALIHGHDDKYKDLPPRVSRLESAVFTPEPR